MLQGK